MFGVIIVKILLVEDDKSIVEIVSKELKKWGYEVDFVSDLNRVVEEFLDKKPQLILMDLVLPFYNGYYWCQEIRKVSMVPIVFVSSKVENMDIVMAMQFGGDDYIVKPIKLDILIAKIQAILRRSYNFINEMRAIEFSGILLNISEARIISGGEEVDLTKTELMIVEELFRAQGSVVKREKLMDRCWQNDNFIDDNTLAVNIARLRKKLSKAGLDDFIETKKGIGYMLKGGGI